MIWVTREGPPVHPGERVMTTISLPSSHFLLPITIRNTPLIRTNAVIDSGAMSSYIDQKFVQKHKIKTGKLPQPIPLANVDGSFNKVALMTEHVSLPINIANGQTEIDFKVAELHDNDVIIGLPWSEEVGPLIDWKEKMLQMPERLRMTREVTKESWTWNDLVDDWEICDPVWDDDEEEWRNDYVEMQIDDELIYPMEVIEADECETTAEELALTRHVSTQIAEREFKAKPVIPIRQRVPKEFHDYLHIFSEDKAKQLPPRRPYDHAIDLKEDAKLPAKRIYPLSPDKQKELDKWLKEEMDKQFIRPSKSPTAAPVFFVKKKDGSWRLVIDYRGLNSITIKNRYPLPLIPNLIDQLLGTQWFTKFDVRNGYNNIRIKKGNEWKGAFVCNRGLFEPLVMYFGMSNSPATS